MQRMGERATGTGIFREYVNCERVSQKDVVCSDTKQLENSKSQPKTIENILFLLDFI